MTDNLTNYPADDDGNPLTPQGDIDFQLLSRLIASVARSFLFFVVQFCWIENKSMSGERIGETKFDLWPAQRQVVPLFLKNRLLAILKARQLGLTWLTAAYCLWCVITRRNFLAIVISAKEEWAIEFLDRVRFMYKRLPAWLMRDLDRDGSQHMRFVYEWDAGGKRPLVYSDIKSLTTTQEGAQSKTPDLLVMDETARNRYAREIFGASKPGIDKAGGQIIVISNSHKRGPGWAWTRGICSGALRGENTFKFLFMPWWDCPERLTPDEAAQLMADPYFTPSHFKNAQLRDGVDPIDVSENYPNTADEALATLHGSYFGDTLSRHSKYVTRGVFGTLYRDKHDKELYFDVRDRGFQTGGRNVFTLWRYPYWLTKSWDGQYWTDRYVMGSDVSEGQGRSNSVAYVMDRQRDELVCRIMSNRIDAVDWAKYLWLLSQYYCNFHVTGSGRMLGRTPAMICVEKTGAGLTTVKELEKYGANQFVRTLFGRRGDHTTDDIGWQETQQSKHVLCADLRNWYKTMRGHIYCQALLDESSTTIEHESGTIGPETGEMWDTVVAAGCTLQASLQVGGPPSIVRPPSSTRDHQTVSNWAL
jgi:hypothetical protein